MENFPRHWTFMRESIGLVDRSFDGFFFQSASEQTVEQAIETPVIWDAIALIMAAL